MWYTFLEVQTLMGIQPANIVKIIEICIWEYNSTEDNRNLRNRQQQRVKWILIWAAYIIAHKNEFFCQNRKRVGRMHNPTHSCGITVGSSKRGHTPAFLQKWKFSKEWMFFHQKRQWHNKGLGRRKSDLAANMHANRLQECEQQFQWCGVIKLREKINHTLLPHQVHAMSDSQISNPIQQPQRPAQVLEFFKQRIAMVTKKVIKAYEKSTSLVAIWRLSAGRC